MPEYTQANRPLKVYTALDENVLLLGGFAGLEALSQPYSFQLDLLSTRADIEPAELLRTPVAVEFPVGDDELRYVHGIVSRFAQVGIRDELACYRAEVVPWLWFLNLSRESRIYQELTVPDILEQVFKRLEYSDFEFRLKRSYSPRLFCVQYRETHFAFVSRLLEEEGICYFFEHTSEKHVLVITDDSSSSVAVPGPETIRFSPEGHTDQYVVSELECEQRVHSGRMTLWEYDYLKPTTSLSAMQGKEHEEVYDYPGGYREHDDGDRLARLLLEAEEAQRQVVRGVSDASGLMPGCHFKLDEHFQKSTNGKYLITQVQHRAQAGGYRAWEDDAGLDYRNDFLAIPHATPYRPRRRTPRPTIHGSQSALVVGKAGEEVWVDKHGRIKVHFYWDRDSNRDEKSSCWIRVATPWGGKGWGAVSIPRIGNEVIVAFEEGDPDRPIVIGGVYNADQTPPFALPGAGIQMGMKSRSSPGGGGMNEITLTDTKGKEQITVHGQYDMNSTIEHDQTTTVHNDQKNTIDNNRTDSVGKNESVTIGVNRTEKVGGNENIEITGNRDEVVNGSESLRVMRLRKHVVALNESIKVGIAQQIAVGGAQSITVGLKQTTKVGKNQDNHIQGKRLTKVGKDDELSVGTKLVINAGDEVVIKTGQASITMKKNGDITIKGKKIEVDAMSDLKLKGMKVASEASTSNLTKGATVNSEASAVNTIKGGLVKIN